MAGRAALGQDCLGWVGHAGAQAPARVDACAVYDARRGVVVLFGGSRQPENQFLADTWEWDGYSWKRVATTGPSARSHHAMAYDTKRGVIVLFGGMTAASPNYVYSGETWEWDGAEWALRAIGGPIAQARHAMAFDEARGVTVLYGRSGSVGETWEWDGAAWINRMAGTPGKRIRHSLVYDRARARTVLFGGGFNNDPDFADTWDWDGSVWAHRPETGPIGRSEHQMVYDSAAGRGLLVAGTRFECVSPEGCGKPKYNDACRLGENGWQQLAPLLNPPRYSHAMAFDDARSRAVVFSGNTTVVYPDGVIADTWELGANGWAQPGSNGPRGRYAHLMTYDITRARTIMFGGSTGGGQTRETWAWDGREWSQWGSANPETSAPSLT